jgi:hypothetical protein
LGWKTLFTAWVETLFQSFADTLGEQQLEDNMVALRNPFGLFSRGASCSDRATAAAFKVGQKAYKMSGGATPALKEVARLYKESKKPE